MNAGDVVWSWTERELDVSVPKNARHAVAPSVM